MPYRVEMAPAARRAMARLSPAISHRIDLAILELEHTPRPPGSKKLSGDSALWRIRVGDYRIVYQIHDQRLLVLVVRIGHRREVYKP